MQVKFRLLWVFCWVLGVGIAALVGCEGLTTIKECYPDTRRICVCRDGVQSTQSCDPQTTTWGLCACAASPNPEGPAAEGVAESPADAASEGGAESQTEAKIEASVEGPTEAPVIME